MPDPARPVPYAFHGGTTLFANLVADIRAAKALGYDGIELWAPKVLRYLDAGFTIVDLKAELDGMPVPMLDVIVGFERMRPADLEARLRECARLAEVAEQIGCPTIQIVATEDFDASSWPEQRGVLVESIRAMTDVTAPHGIKLAIEPLVYSPFNSITRALEVINAVGRDDVGLCLDTWHLWTSGEDWDAVASLDPSLILSAQLSDTLPKCGPQWRDSVRAALPGDGILPVRDAVHAIEATGYDGHWCVEMLSDAHREWDQLELGAELLDRLGQLVPARRS